MTAENTLFQPFHHLVNQAPILNQLYDMTAVKSNNRTAFVAMKQSSITEPIMLYKIKLLQKSHNLKKSHNKSMVKYCV